MVAQAGRGLPREVGVADADVGVERHEPALVGTETIPIYGSIVRLDEIKSQEMYTAFRKDNLRAYLKKYPDDVLKPPDEVG